MMKKSNPYLVVLISMVLIASLTNISGKEKQEEMKEKKIIKIKMDKDCKESGKEEKCIEKVIILKQDGDSTICDLEKIKLEDCNIKAVDMKECKGLMECTDRIQAILDSCGMKGCMVKIICKDSTECKEKK